MDEVLKDFIVECYEGLDHLDRDLISLEQDPSSDEILSRIFRTIHTIKGSSGFLALEKLEAVAHVGENLLSRLRDKELSLTAEMTSALLAMADAVRVIVDHLERDQTEGDANYDELVDTLTKLTSSEDAGESTPAPATTTTATPAAEAKPSPTEGESTSRASISDSTIRVDVRLLDKLMNLVGELVLARNQILQHNQAEPGESGNMSFDDSTTQRLNLVTTELQEGVMKTRMQPIGNLWSKMPRVVRDLSITCGKDVRVEMEGRDTELDKTILEAIKDPLTHIIRNSVDHGIEAPDARATAGKPPQGCIRLRAYHEGGHVNIEILDDGGGIHPDKVRDKAISNGMITPEKAARLSEKDIINLITMPGFSTAEKVTNVSGRGVGMDVVRTNIEKIGGSIDIQSEPGSGTAMKIKIPLTLAIIPALIVTDHDERFAIPQVNLLELLRLEGEQMRTGIETIHGTPVYRLRGALLPLVYLDELLETRDPDGPQQTDNVSIVVLQAGDRPFGLVVQSILDTEEIVVKSLGKQLKSLSTFAGAAIMGDGKVALILDVFGLGQQAGIIGEGSSERAASGGEGDSQDVSSDRETLLLVATNENERAAIPLSAVARLEEFESATIEHTAGREVVQYRGEIMPLIRLSQAIGHHASAPDAERMHVVVVRASTGSVGIVVQEIFDIIHEEIRPVQHVARPGIRGAVTVQGKVTDLLDLEEIIQNELPGVGLTQATVAV